MYRLLSFFLIAIGICYGQAIEEARDAICAQRNNYYPVDASCDAYIECRDYIAHELMCPDGLHFNPTALWPYYPCSYPSEVTCLGRGAPQPAIPTAECPHQYGIFPSPAASDSDCGLYRMCVEGRAIDMSCPAGLAFNPNTTRCDYPEFVPSCNAEAFLGFKCPELKDANGELIDMAMHYKYPGNCDSFYSCERGHARLLSCDLGLNFDPSTGHCENADKVQCMASGNLL